jgi:hypothetical protein
VIKQQSDLIRLCSVLRPNFEEEEEEKLSFPFRLIMASPTRSNLSPTVSRVTAIIPNTTVISPRSISSRSQLEESISTLQSKNTFLVD